jgi:hypothetical protein
MDARLALPVAVILGAPILAAPPFRFRFGFVENILVRILLVGVIIYAVLEDLFLGLVVFLAVFTLLLERNHALALSFTSSFDSKTHKPVSVNVQKEEEGEEEKEEEEGESKKETNNHGIKDNIPRLSPAPGRNEVGAFYKFKTL